MKYSIALSGKNRFFFTCQLLYYRDEHKSSKVSLYGELYLSFTLSMTTGAIFPSFVYARGNFSNGAISDKSVIVVSVDIDDRGSCFGRGR